MSNKWDDFLRLEIFCTKTFKLRLIDLFCFIMVSGLCMMIRLVMFPYISGDFSVFLENWFNILKENGGFGGLSISIGDYTPAYFYILALLTYLPVDPLFSIKLVSCLFDFFLAFLLLKSVYLLYKKFSVALLAYAVLLLTPTVLLNSAAWAQCDAIYVTFLLLCVLALMRNRPIPASLWFGVALCFKLQAVFIAPLLLLFWLKKKMKFWHFLLIPVTYIVSIVPSALAGRSFTELLTIYIAQSGQYEKMSLNAPNLYLFAGDNDPSFFSVAAIIFCAVAVGMMLYLLYCKTFQLIPQIVLTLALFFALLVPFLLPHMHERYFYLADILSVFYVFHRPKRWYIAVTVVFASLCCYMPFLFGIMPLDLKLTAFMILFALVALFFDLLDQMGEPNEKILRKKMLDRYDII